MPDIKKPTEYTEAYLEAVEWMKSELQKMLEEEKTRWTLERSIVHFFSTATGSGPLCEQGDHGEWVRYDHTAAGVICSNCQQILNRRIT